MVRDRLRREWSYPAGYVEPGESELEACVREIGEEVNLHLEPARYRLLGRHTVRHRLGELTFTTYSADITADEADNVRRQFIELTNHRWTTSDEAIALTSDRLRDRLRELLTNH